MGKLICIVFILNSFLSIGQTVVSGSVYDNDNNQAIAYANVGIVEKSIGTITNSDGVFNFMIPDNCLMDTLTISCIGYQNIRLCINELENNGRFSLISLPFQIEAINVKPKATLTKGRVKTNGLTVIFQRKEDNKNLTGGEIAMTFNNNKRLKLNEIEFLISRNTYDTVKVRVNIYSAKNTRSDAKLNPKDCIITIANKETGWFKADVSNNNIVINKKDYLIALEIVDIYPVEGQLAFVGGFKPYAKRTMVRDVSFGNWKKQPLSLSINAKADIL